MFAALERLGYDLDSLLISAGLCRSDIEDLDARLTARACAQVFANARSQQRVKNLPLRLAMETPIGAHPLLDYIIASSESVGEGLRRLRRYLRLVNPSISMELCEHEEPVRVAVEAPDRFAVELTVSLSVVRLRGETSGRLAVQGISFRHEPDDIAEYVALLRCPVHAKAAWNGWELARESYRLPMRRRDPVLRNWLEREADRILASESHNQSVADEVRRVLASRMAAGDMDILTVAQQLGMTPRTLQRRLAEEETTYDSLRSSLRKTAAETLLADKNLSIAEAAYLLGYSEPAAFHRAFKRWYGTGPQAFRDRRL